MKKSTIIEAMSLISDDHISEVADVMPKSQHHYAKSYAVLAAGIVAVLCIAPIIHHTVKKDNIAAEVPPVSVSNNLEDLTNGIVSAAEESSARSSERAENTNTSAVLTSSDKNEDHDVSERSSPRAGAPSKTDNNLGSKEISSGGDERALSRNEADHSDSGNSKAMSETHSLAEATSDIDPSVDRSRIPDVSKIAVSQDSDSSTAGGSLQSEAYNPGTPDDTDVWYDPDVFYDANSDEKGYDSASQLIEDSQVIIVGTVESIDFEAPPANEDPMAKTVTPDGWRMGTIFTVYTVKIEEVYKGDISSEQYIRIYSFGGIRDQMVGEQLSALGGDRMIPIVDRIDAQTGSRYIFMLAERAHYVPVNAGQSIYAADDGSFTSLYGEIKSEDVYNALVSDYDIG